MKYFISAALLACCLVSCNQTTKGPNGVVYKNAVEYNDYIVSRQTTMMKNVLDFVQVSQTDLDSASKMLDHDVEQLDGMITDIQGMPPFRKDTALRNAAVGTFQFYRRVFGNEYKQLINIRKNGGAETQAGQDEMKSIVASITEQEEGYDKRFHNAQKDFAEKNHIKLAENEMQKKIDNMGQ